MDEYLAARAEPAFQQAGHWLAYLEMLSVERTKPFISALALPAKRSTFPQVMRLSRACLEVFMFPSPSPGGSAGYPRSFGKHWRQYRDKEGVLSDAALRNFAEPRKHLDTRAWFVSLSSDLFDSMQKHIGSDGDALRGWFHENYLPSLSWFEFWPSVFLRLLRNDNRKNQFAYI